MKMHHIYHLPHAQNSDIYLRSKHIKILLSLLVISFNQHVFSQQIIYSTDFGNTGTALGSLAPGWASSGSNHLQISTNAISNNYISPIAASGAGNLCDCGNSTGTAIATISSGISTINFEEIRVLFGYRRTAAYNGTVNLEWSIDGTNWNQLPFTALNNSSWSLANTTWFTLPATASNQKDLSFRFIFTRNSTGQENFRIDDFYVLGKSTTGITQPHHYFRSLKSGQWEYATTWQSSADSIQWADASLAPGATAAGITIQTPHAISINDLAYGRLVKIEKGATLNLTNDVTFILTNALENPDMIICGAFILNGNRPSNTTNATYTVEEGGIVKVVNNSGLQQSDDFIHTNPLIKFKTGSVFEWSAPTPFESANKTYFNTSSDEHPIFRISRTLFMGSAAPNHTVINGFVEVANGNTLYIQNSGTRYFRDGFGGAGNIQMTGGCIEITGTNRIYTRIYGSGSVLMSSTTSGITVSNQAKVSLSSDYIINGSGFNFSVNQGGSLHCGINTLYGSANFILASGAELGIGSADGISNGSTGNIQTAGSSFNARGIYQYNGSANQITGDALPENIQGGIVLKNNGTSGNNQITITKNLLISGFMEFNQGILITNNTDKILCFNTNSYTAGANFHSYVAGPVKKIGNTPFIFPLGKPPVAFTIPGDPPANGFAGGYRPLEISNLSGIDTFQTEFIVSNPTIWKIKKEASDKGLQQISTCEYWNLNRSGNTRADVTLSWSVNSMGQSQCNIINPANPSYLQVVPFYNGEWGDRHDTYFGNSAIKTEAVTGLTYISWNGDRPANDINSYEKFVVGSVNTAESPLPLTIQNFDIEYIRKKVRIGWHDHHPEEIKTYILEKSKDGKIFDQLKIIQPRYNNYRKAYEEYDMHPHEGWNYYRLSIIDSRNHLEHSSIKKIRVFSKENAAPISYTSGHHYLHLNNHIQGHIHMLTIANLAGQVLYKQYKVSKNIQINVGSLPHGLYLLSIYSSQRIINQLFTKE